MTAIFGWKNDIFHLDVKNYKFAFMPKKGSHFTKCVNRTAVRSILF